MYWTTRAPGPIPGDSAELVTASVTLGVCHPTGYPLTVLIGYLIISCFAFASPAAVLNLASGAMIVVALTVICAAGRRLGLSPESLAAGIALLATTPSIWSYATIAEVYALQILLVSGVIWMAARCVTSPTPRVAGVLGLLTGLGFGGHMSTVFLIPALAGLVGGLLVRDGKRILRSVAAPLLAGIAVGSAVLGLHFAFDRPETLNYINQYATEFPDSRFESATGRFVWLVTAEQFSASDNFLSSLVTGKFLSGFRDVSIRLLRDSAVLLGLGGIGLCLAALGFSGLRKAREIALAGIILIVTSLVFYSTYADFEPIFFLSGFVFCTLGVAFAVHAIPDQRIKVLVVAGVIGWCFFSVTRNVARIDRWGTEYYEIETVAFLEEIESDAVVFATWRDSTLLWYETMVRGVNPTVTIVNARPDHWLRMAFPYRGRPMYFTVVPPGVSEAAFTPFRHFFKFDPP